MDVATCEMEESAHCEHFRRHPDRYHDAVGALMAKLTPNMGIDGGAAAGKDGGSGCTSSSAELFDPAKYRLNIGSRL